MGALLACASSTIRMIWASAVPAPTRVARKRNRPVLLSVPPMTSEPARFSTGMDSPVSMDSSTADAPSITSPSVGIFSPGFTMTVSPTITDSAGTSISAPSRITCAFAGFKSMSLRTAAEERFLIISSMYLPSSTNAMMTALTSKYTSRSSTFTGRTSGKKITAML